MSFSKICSETSQSGWVALIEGFVVKLFHGNTRFCIWRREKVCWVLFIKIYYEFSLGVEKRLCKLHLIVKFPYSAKQLRGQNDTVLVQLAQFLISRLEGLKINLKVIDFGLNVKQAAKVIQKVMKKTVIWRKKERK